MRIAGSVRASRWKNRPYGPESCTRVADREVLEDPPVGAEPARGPPDLQLDAARLPGRVRHRVGPGDVRPRNVDRHVLPGVERHLVVEVDHEPAGLPGDVVEHHHGADEVLHRVVDHALLEVDVRLDRDVGARGGDAGQRLALVALELHEGEVRGVVVLDVAVEHLHLAGAAGAVRAGVREPHPGTQTGVEYRLVRPALDLPAERLDRDRERLAHGCPLRLAREGKGRPAGSRGPGPGGSAGPAQVRKVNSPLCPTPVSSSVVSSAGLKSSPLHLPASGRRRVVVGIRGGPRVDHLGLEVLPRHRLAAPGSRRPTRTSCCSSTER